MSKCKKKVIVSFARRNNLPKLTVVKLATYYQGGNSMI